MLNRLFTTPRKTYNTFELQHIAKDVESNNNALEAANSCKGIVEDTDLEHFLNYKDNPDAIRNFRDALINKRDELSRQCIHPCDYPCISYTTLISLGLLAGTVVGTGLSAVVTSVTRYLEPDLVDENTFLEVAVLFSGILGTIGGSFGFILADEAAGAHTPYKWNQDSIKKLTHAINLFDKIVEPAPVLSCAR